MKFQWNWKEFCGSANFTIWTDSHQDFSECFQILCLQIPVLFLIALISAFYAGKYEGWTIRTLREKYIINVRLAVVLILALLPPFRIITLVNFSAKSLHVVNYFFVISESVTWFIHFIYITTLKHRLGCTLRGPVILGSLYTMFYVICVIRIRSLYASYNSDGLTNQLIMLIFAVITLIFQTLYGLTLLPEEDDPTRRAEIDSIDQRDVIYASMGNGYYRFREDFDPYHLGTAMEGSGFVSKFFFSWVNPLIDKGKTCQIHGLEDIFELPDELTCSALHDKLKKALDNGSDVNLVKGLHRCFAKEFYGIGILKFIADLAGFISPLLLHEFMNFIDDPSTPVARGYFYGLSIFLASLIGLFCSVHFSFCIGRMSLKLRGSLIARIYWKILYLNARVLRDINVGEIVNHISTDMEKISNSCISFHAVWSIPFQVLVTLYLLYTQVGAAFLAGVLLSVILIPINKMIAIKIANLGTSMMREKDGRVGMMREVIRGIKVIKLHNWEEYFVSKILGIRHEEMKYLKGGKYLDALCVYFWATTPVWISVLTFTVYVYWGGELSAATIFTSLTLLNMLITPLNAFPWVLNGLMEAWVSIKRVDSYLQLDEVNIFEYSSIDNDSKAITIQDGNFSWTLDRMNLNRINLSISKGSLVEVIGPVGSGKSSLLAAIMGEISGISGFVAVDDIENGIGYASQVAWIQQCSVRDNILFGKLFDAARYRTVVNACALNDDFYSWPDGDLELVGEAGCTLSGGQKTRIALARAVYQNKSVYVLDDVLASLDNQVAEHVFHECIVKLLDGKTRILVTHFNKFLNSADWIVKMENERITEQGPPHEIIPNAEEIFGKSPSDQSTTDYEPDIERDILKEQAKDERREIEMEQRNMGIVSFSVYISYCKSVGYILSLFVIISVVIMQISKHAVDWWISSWVSVDTNYFANNFTDYYYLSEFKFHIIGHHMSDIKYFLVVYISLGIVNSLIAVIRAFSFAYAGIRAAKRIHESLLAAVLQARMEFFDVSPLGRILNRFASDTNTVDNELPFDINNLLAQLVSVIGILFMTIYGIGWLCLLVAPLVPMYVNIQNRYRSTSRELKRLESVTLSPLYSHVSETITGITTIRAFKESEKFIRDSQERVDNVQKCTFSSMAAAIWLSIRLQMIGVIIIGGICVIAALQRHFDVAHSGFVGLAISYALTLTGNLGGVVQTFAETEQKMVAMERIDEYIRESNTDFQSFQNENEIILPFAWPGQGVVSFMNVSLKYREDIGYSLKNINFETHPSEKIGIVGRTGAGKSSIFAVLCRLTDATSGVVCIDAINIANVFHPKLRSKITIIPQDPFLFAGTVRENIDPLNEYSDFQIGQAIGKCKLDTMINKIGGIEGLLKTGGSNISVGERQLLCLVRAVIRNSKIVCIDEATSNIDQKTEKKIRQVLKSSFKQSTVLMITHKLECAEECDRVLVMGHGEILEFDSPQLLKANENSHFRKLFSL